MSIKNKIGEKIKNRRIELSMTQKDVCEEFMTRNMLSLIENGSSAPSIETAEYLARKLSLPLAYIFSESDDLFTYEKNEKIGYIKELFHRGNYEYCISVIDSLSGTDDELNYIYAYASFEYGKKLLMNGSLMSAAKYLSIASDKAKNTIYDTKAIASSIPLYLAVTVNIHSPLLEFDPSSYLETHSSNEDYEFYKYITLDGDFDFKNELYSRHLAAKKLIKQYKYADAIQALQTIEESKLENYNACVLFGVYTDLENSYKQLGDFENAYRYSAKRMSMINGFKS